MKHQIKNKVPLFTADFMTGVFLGMIIGIGIACIIFAYVLKAFN